jgi:hypothetical protein
MLFVAMKLLGALALILSASLAACSPHFAGELRIDGAPFQPVACRSGQAHGFAGIELTDAAGSRLRVAENLDGTASTVYFPSGARVGKNLGACGGVRAFASRGVINGVQNLDGSVMLACSATSPRVEGALRFENCH